MVRLTGPSSNLFNGYLVEPQFSLILEMILNQFAIRLEKAYANYNFIIRKQPIFHGTKTYCFR